MFKRLLLIITLIYSNSVFAVKSWDIINLENWIIINKLTKQDVLNNKNVNPCVKIKDWLLHTHTKLYLKGANDLENQKLFHLVLTRLGLKFEDLIDESHKKPYNQCYYCPEQKLRFNLK